MVFKPRITIQIRLIKLIEEKQENNIVISQPKQQNQPTNVQKQTQEAPVSTIKHTPAATIQKATPTPPPKQTQQPTTSVKTEQPTNPLQNSTPEIKQPAPTPISTVATQTNSASTPASADHNTKWNAVLEKLRQEKPATFSMLRNSSVLNCENNCLSIKLQQSFSFFFEKVKRKNTIRTNHKFSKNRISRRT